MSSTPHTSTSLSSLFTVVRVLNWQQAINGSSSRHSQGFSSSTWSCWWRLDLPSLLLPDREVVLCTPGYWTYLVRNVTPLIFCTIHSFDMFLDVHRVHPGLGCTGMPPAAASTLDLLSPPPSVASSSNCSGIFNESCFSPPRAPMESSSVDFLNSPQLVAGSWTTFIKSPFVQRSQSPFLQQSSSPVAADEQAEAVVLEAVSRKILQEEEEEEEKEENPSEKEAPTQCSVPWALKPISLSPLPPPTASPPRPSSNAYSASSPVPTPCWSGLRNSTAVSVAEPMPPKKRRRTSSSQYSHYSSPL